MNDIYCDQIIPKLIDVEIVSETGHLFAFHHTNPYWERHIVIVPKDHIESLSRLTEDHELLKKEIMDTLIKISSTVEKDFGGCSIVTNVGDQQTSKHLHWYIYAGRKLRNEDGTMVKI